MRRIYGLLAAFVLVLAVAAPAGADSTTTPASEIARTGGSFMNTGQYTPTFFDMYPTSYACTKDVGLRTAWTALANKWKATPLPCFFTVSAGNDGEAVLVDHGLKDGIDRTYEFYQAQNGATGYPGWSARWGGAEPTADFGDGGEGIKVWPVTDGGAHYGVQASGLAFNGTVIRVKEFQAGLIPHAIGLEVPEACFSFVPPATRHDGAVSYDSANCIQYGSKWRLPAGYDCSTLGRRATRTICAAARDYGFVVSDQTHYQVGMRAENWKRPWASWGGGSTQVDPYRDPTHPELNLFECPDPVTYQCYPDQNNMFKYFPWGSLARVN